MRQLTPLTRRRFGRGMGAALTLAGCPGVLRAHDGPHDVEVRIDRFAFVPHHVEVEVGDSITWINADFAPHTATADDGAWGTDTLDKGQTGKITFDVPGAYLYHCAFHPHMTGRVWVLAKTGIDW